MHRWLPGSMVRRIPWLSYFASVLTLKLRIRWQFTCFSQRYLTRKHETIIKRRRRHCQLRLPEGARRMIDRWTREGIEGKGIVGMSGSLMRKSQAMVSWRCRVFIVSVQVDGESRNRTNPCRKREEGLRKTRNEGLRRVHSARSRWR